MDEHGARRIDSPNDFVRIEIEAALKRGIPVVPVYVDDAKFLREADLPDSLKDLAWYNGYNLSTDGSKFAASIASLIAKLEPHFTDAIRPAQPEPKPQPAEPVTAAAIIRPAPEAREPAVQYEDAEQHLVRTFWGHQEPVNSVAFSPEGTFALSASGEERILQPGG